MSKRKHALTPDYPSAELDPDYTMDNECQWVWITVGDISVRIYRRPYDVQVAMFPVGLEFDLPLATATLSYREVEQAKRLSEADHE